ncbi:substrate-binding domain-containing protein [Salipaludibacillus sp. CUR1]|uniref:substrate-binding domain-containing protein n=1 Tax=Salipaludibacillus sp. CUR1 TaxID=2820003 RepID=UPI001E365090|nr:substrate-binding domain-containing protein [Salipaludibacillus sp. CUR1]MCE7793676.1 substrate-binding domain-containing protein [Salipaludibacillus sp. CUR1]
MKQVSKCMIGMVALSVLAGCANSEENASGESDDIGGQMILATTTSTYDSGLLDELVPVFEEETGTDVKIISVGSGQALAMGENGEADVLLVHAPAQEEVLEEEGAVINRHRVMHNDFVILGPEDDPANINSLPVDEALSSIADNNHSFYSRGDDSGTHFKELDLWESAQVEPDFEAYEETGQGMGDTLRITAEKDGYTLSDRGTFLYLKDVLDPLSFLVEGDQSLENIYHVMQVNPDLSDQINAQAGEAFVSFFVRDDTQMIIKNYGIDEWGEPLFFPHLID